MERYGALALFAYTSAVHAAFIVVALWRIAAGRAIPRAARGRFVALPRTSPAIYWLAGLCARRDDGDS